MEKQAIGLDTIGLLLGGGLLGGAGTYGAMKLQDYMAEKKKEEDSNQRMKMILSQVMSRQDPTSYLS